jgi:hypothetical protein
MKYGPFFAIVNPDGSLHADNTGDPYVFKQMGPHDNHSQHGRKVEQVYVLKVEPSTDGKFGPYSAVIAKDGSLATNSIGDPLIHKSEHAPQGCKPAFIVVMDEREFEQNLLRGTEVRELREEVQQLKDTIAKCTSVNISAAAGESMDAHATFQGVAVQAFAAHMAHWFDKEGGKNFVTLDMNAADGRRFELTMQRAGGETPAQKLVKMRWLLEDIYRRELGEFQNGSLNDPKYVYQIEDMLGLPSTKPPPSNA